MKAKDILAAVRDGRLTRRQLAALLGSVGVGTATMRFASRPARADGELLYFGWAGYEDPKLHEAYLAEHNAPPQFAFWADMEEAFQKLRQGYAPDVMHPCSDVVTKWRNAKLVAPIDEARLDHLPDLFKSVLTLHGTVVDGQRYFVPFEWGNSTIIYRTDLLDPADQGSSLSYNLLFDPKYKGRIAMWDEGVAIVQAAGLALGYDNIFSLSSDQLVEVRKLMERQRDIVRFYWTDNTEMEQSLASGEISAGWGWNNSYARLLKEGAPVAFGVPKEGIRTWVCGLTIHPDTPHLDEAYDLINAMTAPESGAYLIENFGFGHSNSKAFAQVDPEILADYGLSSPEKFLTEGVMYEPMEPALEEKYYSLFEEVKAGT